MKKTILKLSLVSGLMISSLVASSSNSYSKSTLISKSTSSHASGHSTHWGYDGENGPLHWGELKSAYQTCQTGNRQSPININIKETIDSNTLDDIFVSYGDVELNIVNNGHTIQVNSDGSSKALLGGKEFKLLQYHFHALSEHTINDKHSAMEVHLVHQSEDGELAVIGIMMNKGKHNNALEKMFELMPKHSDESIKSKYTINANNLLPKDKGYFHYVGSLTTPPCTQIVQWYVLKNHITISNEQLQKFHSLYNGNYRPIQKIGTRKIISK